MKTARAGRGSRKCLSSKKFWSGGVRSSENRARGIRSLIAYLICENLPVSPTSSRFSMNMQKRQRAMYICIYIYTYSIVGISQQPVKEHSRVPARRFACRLNVSAWKTSANRHRESTVEQARSF